MLPWVGRILAKGWILYVLFSTACESMPVMSQKQQAATVRVRATITGEVQGVNFRAECREQALQHGLIGWVRNDSDGSVESVCEGSRESVRLILEWCEHGPTGARVRKVATRCEDPTGKDAGFDVRR